jgi:cytochrome b pre-mRNA-processing protein 3
MKCHLIARGALSTAFTIHHGRDDAGDQMKGLRLFSPSKAEQVAETLYGAIVAQARRPEFYTVLGVPDTPDGRFDLIVAHAVLVFRRLKSDEGGPEDVAQALFDHMFADMDENLREMGVGDLSVGKRVKAMAKGFYGRLAAYDAALSTASASALEAALARNLFRKAAPDVGQLEAMARYLQREAALLAAQPCAELTAGGLRFGPPPELDG